MNRKPCSASALATLASASLDRETYISIRCPACARVHLVNPVTGKTPANG